LTALPLSVRSHPPRGNRGYTASCTASNIGSQTAVNLSSPFALSLAAHPTGTEVVRSRNVVENGAGSPDCSASHLVTGLRVSGCSSPGVWSSWRNRVVPRLRGGRGRSVRHGRQRRRRGAERMVRPGRGRRVGAQPSPSPTGSPSVRVIRPRADLAEAPKACMQRPYPAAASRNRQKNGAKPRRRRVRKDDLGPPSTELCKRGTSHKPSSSALSPRHERGRARVDRTTAPTPGAGRPNNGAYSPPTLPCKSPSICLPATIRCPRACATSRQQPVRAWDGRLRARTPPAAGYVTIVRRVARRAVRALRSEPFVR
jgi:hypothetical protein